MENSEAKINIRIRINIPDQFENRFEMQLCMYALSVNFELRNIIFIIYTDMS